jgi:hypothetical protein
LISRKIYFSKKIQNSSSGLFSVRLDHFISTIQLPDMIELDTYARLQVHILHNEIRARLNDGNISSSIIEEFN